MFQRLIPGKEPKSVSLDHHARALLIFVQITISDFHKAAATAMVPPKDVKGVQLLVLRESLTNRYAQSGLFISMI